MRLASQAIVWQLWRSFCKSLDRASYWRPTNGHPLDSIQRERVTGPSQAWKPVFRQRKMLLVVTRLISERPKLWFKSFQSKAFDHKSNSFFNIFIESISIVRFPKTILHLRRFSECIQEIYLHTELHSLYHRECFLRQYTDLLADRSDYLARVWSAKSFQESWIHSDFFLLILKDV